QIQPASPLSLLPYFFTSLLPIFKPVQLDSAPLAARRAAAFASRRAGDRPGSQRRARFAFRLILHSRDAACWAADFARRNNGLERRGRRALWRESRVRWRQSPEAARARGTFHHRDASIAFPRACACA